MGLMAAGGAASAGGTLFAGAATKSADYFKAAQLDQQAAEARAAGQRAGFERTRDANFAQSALQARLAASGGAADDPTSISLASGIAGRGEYESLSEIYKGENRARGYADAAMGERMSGDAARTGSYFGAAGTILSSAGSMAKVYANMDDPNYRGNYYRGVGRYG